MKTKYTRPFARTGDERGFTAMEVAMVATVIAILALIVVPIFRNRVEEAKISAARADINSLVKAETLAHADSDFYYRLEDLDNITMAADASTNPPNNGITIETPPMYYRTAMSTADTSRNPMGLDLPRWRVLAGTQDNPRFKGPYATFTKVEDYKTLRDTNPVLFRSTNGNQYAAIRDIPQGSPMAGDPAIYDAEDNRIPVDPWGNPYLFFPAVNNPDLNNPDPGNEANFNYNSIFSLGPDGLPGDGTGPNGYQNFLREMYNGQPYQLGKGDDIEVRF